MKIGSSYLLALLICIAAVMWILSGGFLNDQTQKISLAKTKSNDNTSLHAVRVRTSVAEQRDEIAHLLGQTQASRRIELHAEIEGRITEVLVERGAFVTSGTVIAKIAIDDRKARLTEARALLNQYQEELEATRILAGKGNRAAIDVTAAQAHLETARALVSRIEIELSRTEIRAPFTGIVETRSIEIGSYLRVGDPVATIVDLDPIRIVGYLSEREITRVNLGKLAQARLLNERIVAGKIAYIATVADPTTRTFRIEIETANPHNNIIEGLTTELMIPIGNITAHRISPAIISLADDGRLGVKIVTHNEIVEFVPIKIVATTPEAMWIDGLPQKVTLISVGHDFVNSGQHVRVVPE